MVEGFARGLASIPFDAPAARHPLDLWADVKTGLDFIAHNLPRAHTLLVRLNPYPAPWRHVRVAGHDGAVLSAWHGPGKPGAPAVVMLPGTFQTKDDTPRKRRALNLWRRLGAHVLILDMRGFGESHALAGTAGHLESRDALAAADWLRGASGAPRVHLWGESFGGATALLAGTLPGAEDRFASILAWSPFADLGEASRVATPDSPSGRTALARTYRWLLRRRTRNEVQTFEEYLDHVAAHLGMTKDDLLRTCSPLHRAGDLRVPAVVFHAEDDPVVPCWHARRLADLRLDGLAVQVLPRGGHLDFDRHAPAWYDAVTRQLLMGPPAPA